MAINGVRERMIASKSRSGLSVKTGAAAANLAEGRTFIQMPQSLRNSVRVQENNPEITSHHIFRLEGTKDKR